MPGGIKATTRMLLSQVSLPIVKDDVSKKTANHKTRWFETNVTFQTAIAERAKEATGHTDTFPHTFSCLQSETNLLQSNGSLKVNLPAIQPVMIASKLRNQTFNGPL
jgi:hypothetical protein